MIRLLLVWLPLAACMGAFVLAVSFLRPGKRLTWDVALNAGLLMAGSAILLTAINDIAQLRMSFPLVMAIAAILQLLLGSVYLRKHYADGAWLVLAAQGIMTACGLLAFACSLWTAHRLPFVGADFERTRWFASGASDDPQDCERYPMAADLRDNILTQRMTRSEVERLLGPGGDKPGEASYILGMCSGFGFDYDTLDIRFDERGKLADARLVQH